MRRCRLERSAAAWPAAGFVFFLACGAGLAASTDASVPEPAALWQGHMHGDTPATLAGAQVIGADRLAAMASQHPVILDVAHPDSPADHGASNRPHLSVPGATWMPGAGSGSADPEFAALFEKRLAELTSGDRDKPVVVFCHPRRWGSWNAAKRATQLGYRHVFWMPTGSEGWHATHKPAFVYEDGAWKAAFDKVKDRAPSRP